MKNKKLENAVAYARKGWLVHPLKPGTKEPLTKWKQEASKKEAQIKEWWDRWPTANVGVVTGTVSQGLIVLDVDVKNGKDGFASLLQLAGGEEPNTLKVSSPSGGYHYYFRAAHTVRNATGIREGLDIRGDGGYIVAPPSVVDDREYTFEGQNTDIEEAPSWLLDALKRRGPANHMPANRSLIPSGQRNGSLFMEACGLRDQGIPKDYALQLINRQNQERCEEPLPGQEVATLVSSAYAYPPRLEKEAFTDIANARYLVIQHGEDIRYVTEFGHFVIWNDGYWDHDQAGVEILRRAKWTAESLVNEVDALARECGNQWYSDARKYALQLQQSGRLKAMIELAKPEVALSQQQLDSNANLLGVQNGVLELDSGTFRDSQRADLTTMRCGVAYDPKAGCPRWKRFLLEIMQQDQEMVDFLQRLAGYWLTGDTSEQKLFFLYGFGANGKSTYINVLLTLLGIYGTQIQPDVLMLKSGTNGGSATPGLAKLRGKRLVVASELPEGRQLDEGMVKQATGQDVIVARHLYQNEFEFFPNFKLVMVGNHQPYVRGTDYGIWRRMCLVPFEAQIPEERRDKGLLEKLTAELPGILNWALDGNKAWREGGLAEPAKVHNATRDYQTEQDVVEAWLEQCCVVQPSSRTPTQGLYISYTKWAQETREWEMTQRKFAQKLREKGYKDYRTGRERGFQGLGLPSEPNLNF